ncbi:MAG: COX15/CtaA family protein [Bacteroidia bacterium]
MKPESARHFTRISQLTLAFVFLVIIAGAVVRATGSGMGCPDWPKCFGKWIPPTDVSQLPADYKERYAGEHHAVAEFNAANTWTEYINRLCGAILGILIFIQFVMSVKFRKVDKKIVLLSLLELLLIGFQGWLGAKVVSSNLAPVKITIHMVVALVILSVAIAIIHKTRNLSGRVADSTVKKGIKTMSIIVLLLTIIQIMLGTQVREAVDQLLGNFDPSFRGEIVDHIGTSFLVHRSFSIIILVVNIYMVRLLLASDVSESLKSYAKWLGAFVLLEVLAGVILSRFALPAPVQPVHLLLGCIIYALQFVVILRVLRK